MIGPEQVPCFCAEEGARGVLVGMHRGFMPFDGVMALHALVLQRGSSTPAARVTRSTLVLVALAVLMTPRSSIAQGSRSRSGYAGM